MAFKYFITTLIGVIGAWQLLFARWIADQRASAHFSTRQLEATDDQTRRRVGRFKTITVVLNMAIGGAITVSCAAYLFR
ncbi:MAG: hypothetical protein ABI323_00645 [Solirubrobacteraceae bacterium]